MTPERWQLMERLYHAAAAVAPDARAALLDEACGGDAALGREVMAMLENEEEAEPFLSDPAAVVAARATAREPAALRAGSQIGAYRVVAPLGAGGMGEV